MIFILTPWPDIPSEPASFAEFAASLSGNEGSLGLAVSVTKAFVATKDKSLFFLLYLHFTHSSLARKEVCEVCCLDGEGWGTEVVDGPHGSSSAASLSQHLHRGLQSISALASAPDSGLCPGLYPSLCSRFCPVPCPSPYSQQHT